MGVLRFLLRVCLRVLGLRLIVLEMLVVLIVVDVANVHLHVPLLFTFLPVQNFGIVDVILLVQLFFHLLVLPVEIENLHSRGSYYVFNGLLSAKIFATNLNDHCDNGNHHKNDWGNDRNCEIELIALLLAFKVKWVAGRVEAVVGRVIVCSLGVRETVGVLGPPNIITSTTVVANSSVVANSNRGIASVRAKTRIAETAS